MTTRSLRASALGFSLPFLICLPVADGAIGVEDRAQALASYHAIAESTGRNIALTASTRTFPLTTSTRSHALTASTRTFPLTSSTE